MKKGFTLIELLAVIVILAMIALIATPIVLNIINGAKETSAERSLELYKESVENAVARYQLKTNNTLLGEYSTTTDGTKLYLKSDISKTPIQGLLIEYTGSTVSCETINIDSKGKIQYLNCKVNNKNITPQTPSEKKYICKRATTLHTEVCDQTSTSYYCSASGYTLTGTKGTTTISYGSLGTNGTLTPGDAFDCDVNGDGTYDAETERFYYVSGKDGDNNSDYATLIYYNNILNGLPDNTSASLAAYDSSNQNWYGPQTAITLLPTKSQWSNITLKDTSRSIKNELGELTTDLGSHNSSTNFSYSDYIARLLTTQELQSSYNIVVGSYTRGELDQCNYLMENTKYSTSSSPINGYWLENPYSGDDRSAWTVFVGGRYIYTTYSRYNTDFGVRPAIVIPKSDISY